MQEKCLLFVRVLTHSVLNIQSVFITEGPLIIKIILNCYYEVVSCFDAMNFLHSHLSTP